MMNLTILVMMYLAVGAALFAQPRPGSAEPADFTWRRQGAIFRDTLPAVLAWPLNLWRVLRS
jgi:ribose/xylose/arabinose/galactoside ABC-type transport system permease subunit